jgi:hypothetical protein
MAGWRRRYTMRAVLTCCAWVVVAGALVALVLPVHDAFGRSCGTALSPAAEAPPDDDSYLDVCRALTATRTDVARVVAVPVALLAAGLTAGTLGLRRSRPWPEHPAAP